MLLSISINEQNILSTDWHGTYNGIMRTFVVNDDIKRHWMSYYNRIDWFFGPLTIDYTLLASLLHSRRWFNLHQMGFSGLESNTCGTMWGERWWAMFFLRKWISILGLAPKVGEEAVWLQIDKEPGLDWMRLAIFPTQTQRNLVNIHEKWPISFFSCSRYVCRMPWLKFGCRFQGIEALTAEPPVAWPPSGIRCVSPTGSRNSRHLRFFVFARIREKLTNSEQFWTICKETQEFKGRNIIAAFGFILAASWLFFFKV